MRTFPAVAIANYFVDKANETEGRVDILKLIKLVYLAHGWHLGYSGKPLIREAVEAWKHGPVIRSVYVAFRDEGRNQITKKSKSIPRECPTEKDIAQGDKHKLPEFLNTIWRVYGKHSGGQLSDMTHKEGTPWHDVWHRQKGSAQLGATISDALIRDYYEGRIKS